MKNLTGLIPCLVEGVVSVRAFFPLSFSWFKFSKDSFFQNKKGKEQFGKEELFIQKIPLNRTKHTSLNFYIGIWVIGKSFFSLV